MEGADRGVQEGRSERDDQAEVRADGPAADLAARPARRRQRARPVRRLAGQRLGDVGPAARARPGWSRTSPTRRGSRTSPTGTSRCSATTARRTCGPGRDADRRPSTTRRSSPRPASTEPPKTWSELLATRDKVKAAGKIPIALGNQTPWITQLIPYAIAPSTAFAQDPNLAQDMLDGKKTFSNSGLAHGLRALRRARQEGRLQQEPERHDLRAAAQQLVGSGKAAMVDPGHRRAAAASWTRRQEQGPTSRRSRSRPPTRRTTLKIPAGVSAGLGASAKRASTWPRPRSSSTGSAARADGGVREGDVSIPLVGAERRARSVLEPFAPFLSENKDGAVHGSAVAERQGPARALRGGPGAVRGQDGHPAGC